MTGVSRRVAFLGDFLGSMVVAGVWFLRAGDFGFGVECFDGDFGRSLDSANPGISGMLSPSVIAISS